MKEKNEFCEAECLKAENIIYLSFLENIKLSLVSVHILCCQECCLPPVWLNSSQFLAAQLSETFHKILRDNRFSKGGRRL